MVLLLLACKSESGESSAPEQSAKGEAPAGAPDENAPATASDKDTGGKAACTLLSREDAEALLGAKVKDPEVDMFSCTYTATDDDLKILSFEVRDASQWDMAKQMSKEMEGDAFEELSGIGDEAFYGEAAGHNVVFKKGSRYGHLLLGLAKDDESKEKVKALAIKLAGKM